MEITSDYSLTKLFITKEVKIFIDKKFAFTIKLKTIRDFYLDQDWNAFYNIISIFIKVSIICTIFPIKFSNFNKTKRGTLHSINQIRTLI